MAKLNDITFNVGMSVSEDTMKRCCLLLEMFLTDHPELELISNERKTSDGERYISVYVTRKAESEDK
jgi:hypothetical protein